MSDELGAGHVGYLNDVASWVGGCSAIRTGDPRRSPRQRSRQPPALRGAGAQSLLGALLAASLGNLAGRPDATKELDGPALPR